jgi:hypothetical protein
LKGRAKRRWFMGEFKGEFKRGLITFLVLWGVVLLVGYIENVTGPAKRAASEAHG